MFFQLSTLYLVTIQRVFRARKIKLLNTGIKDYLFVKRNFRSLNPFAPGNFASFFPFAAWAFSTLHVGGESFKEAFRISRLDEMKGNWLVSTTRFSWEFLGQH